MTAVVTRKAGLRCPRCIGGQLLTFHEGEIATCLMCGFEPAAAELAGLHLLGRRRQRGEDEQRYCIECGVPVTSRGDQQSTRCRPCHDDHVRGPEFRDEMRRLMRGLPS